MLSRISATWLAGSASSSIRLTKITTSRARTFEISRISAMSTVESAWCAERTTTHKRLSRIACRVICSRIMKVSFTPGVSRRHRFTGRLGPACSHRSADLVMSAIPSLHLGTRARI
jgi:hypothetical protein